MEQLNPVFIKAISLSDAWFQTLYQCVEQGQEFTIDSGSYENQKRLEFDYITIQITKPWIEPLIPKLNPLLNIPDPVAEGYLDDYLPYLMTGEEKEGESYTYGQRLTCSEFKFLEQISKNSKIMKNDLDIYSNSNIIKKNGFVDLDNDKYFLNQLELMIWTYRNKGYRNNQLCLQVAQPSDMLLKDPPCLRHIDTRIQNGKLHFFPYFRSWDLYSGFPANLAAIEMMRQYCVAEIGLDSIEGEIIASCKGLHSYDYCFELMEKIRGRKIEEFKE
jgi:thymidylate synthase